MEAEMMVDQKNIASAFNEWMRRFIEQPERFMLEWQSVTEFQKQINDEDEPSYGQNCAAYLDQLLREQRMNGASE